MRKLLLVLLAVVVVVAIGGYLFLGKLEQAVADKIVQQGERLFGTEVSVSGVELHLLEGRAAIGEITVANPAGFSQPNAMSLSGISAQVDYKSRVIREVVVNQPRITAEVIGGRINLQELAANINQATRSGQAEGGASGEAPGEPPAQEGSTGDDDEQEPLILTVERAAITGARVELYSDKLDQPKQFGLDLIEARDLKGSPHFLGNKLALALFNDMLQQILLQAAIAVGQDQLDNLKQKAIEKLNELLQ